MVTLMLALVIEAILISIYLCLSCPYLNTTLILFTLPVDTIMYAKYK